MLTRHYQWLLLRDEKIQSNTSWENSGYGNSSHIDRRDKVCCPVIDLQALAPTDGITPRSANSQNNIFEKYSNMEFHVNPSSCSMRKDGRTDMTKLVVPFGTLWKCLKAESGLSIWKATTKKKGFVQYIYTLHSWKWSRVRLETG